jgi:hypothetical protein
VVYPARLVVRRTTAHPPADGAHDLATSGD